MNLFVLLKLVQSPDPDEERFECDPEMVKKVKTYFQRHKKFREMDLERILIRRAKEIADEERKVILLPQLFHLEVILNTHDRQGYQEVDKRVFSLQVRFAWPGINQVVQKPIGSCPVCQECKSSKASRPFTLESIATGSPNELV